MKTQQASNGASSLESEHKTVEKLVVQPIEINSGGRNQVFFFRPGVFLCIVLSLVNIKTGNLV